MGKKKPLPKLSVAPERREEFEKKAWQIHLLAKCVGWDIVDEAFFLPEIPAGGRRRERLRKARQMRVAWVIGELKDAGLEVTK